MTRDASVDWDDIFLTAALEPDRWLESLDMLARHTGARCGQLIGIGGARNIPFNLVSNFDADHIQEFIEIDGGSPIVNFRVAANEELCARGFYDPIVHEKHYDDVKSRLASDRYEQWCEDLDIPFGCQTNLVVDRVGLIGFATLRGRKDGRTTATQRRVFAKAAQAARRAVRLQERLEGQQAKLLAGAFEGIGIAAFILDARGQLLSHTTGAEAHLRQGDIRVQHGLLEASGRPFSLAQAVSALTSDPGMAHVRFAIDSPGGRPPIHLEGFRLPVRPWSLGKLPFAILVCRKPARDRAGIGAFLGAIYGLTPAEADVAMRLYEGKSRGLIAEERAVTSETLKSQIKRIYDKMGLSGEGDLIRGLAPLMH
ncbi:helix-turn-helix transcriptional regulator [Sphingomonas sp. 3P27F8]|uniref:helix-turn-helix transcriptional regulator n=1 Tax=Sphingomonas sp. 3P27F8 TaxID=2502213 RepID=UPI0010F5BEF0|nr:helix-turn-helix transcriptional regulator [Sphingomonas sp. 3P27F8]